MSYISNQVVSYDLGSPLNIISAILKPLFKAISSGKVVHILHVELSYCIVLYHISTIVNIASRYSPR